MGAAEVAAALVVWVEGEVVLDVLLDVELMELVDVDGRIVLMMLPTGRVKTCVELLLDR